MSHKAKEVVRSFYESNLLKDDQAFTKFFHPEIELYWNSSFGFNKKNFNEIKIMFSDMAKSFQSLECVITHMISEEDQVSVRYTYLAKTIENPEKEEAIAHFIVIWELKDNKLYRGYQISQQGDSSQESLKTYLK